MSETILSEDWTRENFPRKLIVDLRPFGDKLGTEKGFRQAIQQLCLTCKLPIVFPCLPDFPLARKNGFVFNSLTIETALALPTKLLNSETYNQGPELRVPMEQIIKAYLLERYRQGLARFTLAGMGWSPGFVDYCKKIYDQPIGSYESWLERMDYKPHRYRRKKH